MKIMPLWNQRRRVPAIAVALLVMSGLALVPLLATDRKPPAAKPEPRPCCPVGISYQSGPGKVVLEQICNTPKRSIFHMRTVGLDSCCTHAPGTILRDQDGRRYPMVGFSGLPACSSGQMSTKANMAFTWEFERMSPKARRITLSEVEVAETTGMVFWIWRDVDLSHCKF